jgi:cell division protein FtsQ
VKRPEGFDPKEPEPAAPPPRAQKPQRPLRSQKTQTSQGTQGMRGTVNPQRPQKPLRPAREPKLPRASRAEATDTQPIAIVDPPRTAAPQMAGEPSIGRKARDETQRNDRREARGAKREAKAQARRFTRHTRRRRAAWISVGAIVAVLVTVLAIAVYSPLLALRTITVEGTSKVSPTAVRSALAGQLGTPLALLDFSRIRSELSNFTLVRSYVTETVPPSTLVIHIIERQPIAVVKNGSGYNRVDAAGVVLSTTPTRGSLPIIDVGTLPTSSSAFRSVANVILAMPKSVKSVVQTITATTADDVRLKLTNARQTVVWGSSSDSTLKADSLKAMLRQSVCKSEPVIDVSAPLAPICGPNRFAQKPKSTSTPTSTSTSTDIPSD